jgi:hypothetical protein
MTRQITNKIYRVWFKVDLDNTLPYLCQLVCKNICFNENVIRFELSNIILPHNSEIDIIMDRTHIDEIKLSVPYVLPLPKSKKIKKFYKSLENVNILYLHSDEVCRIEEIVL